MCHCNSNIEKLNKLVIHFIVALLLQRKRERENNNTLHGHGASTSGKKYNNEPSSSKKYKKADPDSEDVSDEVILKAIKRINESNYANKTEVKFI